MKREYQKPYLAVESFQLDAAVAASCSNDGKATINHGLEACVSADDYFGIACELAGGVNVTDGNYEDDTFCYHGPISDMSQFYVSS